MDTLLVVLVLSGRPMLASELATLTNRGHAAVRATLARLGESGLARSTRVDSRGPVGTYRWEPTPAGAEAVSELVTWLRKTALVREGVVRA